MANTSEYKFTDAVGTHKLTGFFPSQVEGETLLKFQTLELKGIAAFGPMGGVITEEDLSPEVAEFLLTRRSAPESLDPNDQGKLLYAHLLEKKAGKNSKDK